MKEYNSRARLSKTQATFRESLFKARTWDEKIAWEYFAVELTDFSY